MLNAASNARKRIEFVGDLMYQWDTRDTSNPPGFHDLPLKELDFYRAQAQVFLENGGDLVWYSNMLADYKRSNRG